LVTTNSNLAALSGSVSSISGSLATISGITYTNKSNISTLSGSVSTISGSLSTVSGVAYTNQSNLATLSGSVSTISGSLSTVSGIAYTNQSDLNTLSGSVSSISGSLTTVSGVAYTNQNDIATLSGYVSTISGVAGNALPITGGTITGDLTISGTTTISGALNIYSSTVGGTSTFSGAVMSYDGAQWTAASGSGGGSSGPSLPASGLPGQYPTPSGYNQYTWTYPVNYSPKVFVGTEVISTPLGTTPLVESASLLSPAYSVDPSIGHLYLPNTGLAFINDTNAIVAMCSSTDGQYIYAVNDAGSTLSVFSSATTELLYKYSLTNIGSPVAIYSIYNSIDGGNTVYILDTANSCINKVQMYNYSPYFVNETIVSSLGGPTILSMAFDLKRNVYWVASDNGEVSIFNISNDVLVLATGLGFSWPIAMQFTSDYEAVFIADPDNGQVYMYTADPTGPTYIMNAYPFGGNPQGVAVCPGSVYAPGKQWIIAVPDPSQNGGDGATTIIYGTYNDDAGLSESVINFNQPSTQPVQPYWSLDGIWLFQPYSDLGTIDIMNIDSASAIATITPEITTLKTINNGWTLYSQFTVPQTQLPAIPNQGAY
jgi:hypothetical protein